MNTCINCERLKSEISILEAIAERLTAECETEAKAAAIALKNADEWSAKLDILEAEKQRIADECFEAKTQLINRIIERDELQRRLDAVVKELKPLQPPCDCQNPDGTFTCRYGVRANWLCENYRPMEEWVRLYALHARAVAIAEGRDNAAP